MFVYTIDNIIGLIVLGIIIVVFGGIYVSYYIGQAMKWFKGLFK